MFEAIFESCAVPAAIVDGQGQVTHCNAAFKQFAATYAERVVAHYPGAKIVGKVGASVHWVGKASAALQGVWVEGCGHSADTISGKGFYFDVSFTPVPGKTYATFFQIVDHSEKEAYASEGAGYRSLMDQAGTLLMTTDADLVINYLNPSLASVLRSHEETLRTLLPQFSVDNLIGVCIDDFHRNPDHQRRLLADHRKLPFRTDIKVGPLNFGLNTTALTDHHGEVIGYATEWFDNNAREDYGSEVQRLYNACREGELDVRGDTGRLDKNFATMMTQINEIVDALVEPVADVRAHLEEVSNGDLTAYVRTAYEGDHAVLKDALNATLDSLNEIMRNVRSSADEIANGSTQVASSSNALSDGATRQAAAIQEISASVSEMDQLWA